jgi:hypothetical protein
MCKYECLCERPGIVNCHFSQQEQCHFSRGILTSDIYFAFANCTKLRLGLEACEIIMDPSRVLADRSRATTNIDRLPYIQLCLIVCHLQSALC